MLRIAFLGGGLMEHADAEAEAGERGFELVRQGSEELRALLLCMSELSHVLQYNDKPDDMPLFITEWYGFQNV